MKTTDNKLVTETMATAASAKMSKKRVSLSAAISIRPNKSMMKVQSLRPKKLKIVGKKLERK